MMQPMLSFCLSALFCTSIAVAQPKDSVSAAKKTAATVNAVSAKDSAMVIKNVASKETATAKKVSAKKDTALVKQTLALKDTVAKGAAAKDSSGVKDTVAVVNDTLTKMDSTAGYSLTIRTEPDSVAIVLNDTVRGLSPLTLSKLQQGEYTFILKKKGYYQKKVAVQVDSSSAKELTVVLTQPGNLVIMSDPTGAEVVFNGEKKGSTPLSVATIKPGDYPVKFTKESYNAFEKSVTVSSGKTDTVFCKLAIDTAVVNAAKRAENQTKKKQSKLTVILLTAAFCLFAGIVTIVDFSGNK